MFGGIRQYDKGGPVSTLRPPHWLVHQQVEGNFSDVRCSGWLVDTGQLARQRSGPPPTDVSVAG